MKHYTGETKILVAVDCIIFGFDGQKLKLLLIKRGFEPELGKWSLMGGFVHENESLHHTVKRVLKNLTGLSGIYLEQLHAFGEPDRDPVERTISVAYFTLINIHLYEKQLSNNYHAEWFPVKEIPELIFDHSEIIEMAQEKLRFKAAFYPILFELLPDKFTLPQLQNVYEAIYDEAFDKRNFIRKVLSSALLIKQKDKDKENSKRGAYYYKIDKTRYVENMYSFPNFIPTHRTKNKH